MSALVAAFRAMPHATPSGADGIPLTMGGEVRRGELL